MNVRLAFLFQLRLQKTMFLKYVGLSHNKQQNRFVHEFLAVSSSDKTVAAVIQSALDSECPNTILLNECRGIFSKLEVSIRSHHKKRKKFVFVVDTTLFPNVMCYLDKRDPTLCVSSADFKNKLENVWRDYEHDKTLIMIDVNSYFGTTNLRVMDITSLYFNS